MTITVLHLRNAKTGAPYRKTLEYGFSLQEAMDARFGNGRKTSKLTLNKVEPDMYACGFLPPHYPVPSTLGEVFFDVGAHDAQRPWANPAIEPYFIGIAPADDRDEPPFFWVEGQGIVNY